MFDFDSYLDRLASADPTPGGGSAAALVGALSAGLCAMVARITQASAKHAAVHPQADALAHDADALRAAFVAARPADEAAYGAVVTASALPRGSDEAKAERTARLQAALAEAAEAPLTVAALALDALALCERTAALGNTHLMSDVECAVRFARAALEASAANVEVNHRFLKNPETVARQAGRLTQLRASAREREAHALALITAQ